MFTGIIEELGIVEKIQRQAGLVNLVVSCKTILEDTKVGDSISVNGVCLTVTSIDKNNLSFDVIQETLRKTNLGNLRLKNKVNLERSLKFTDRLSGHLVTGHIDCIGIIRQKSQVLKDVVFNIAIPPEFSKYIVPKGSVAVDGISLTVVEVKGNVFSVHIIPHTAKITILGSKGPSDRVNIEVDLIGKYVSSMLKSNAR